jgi:hypothetical protein
MSITTLKAQGDHKPKYTTGQQDGTRGREFTSVGWASNCPPEPGRLSTNSLNKNWLGIIPGVTCVDTQSTGYQFLENRFTKNQFFMNFILKKTWVGYVNNPKYDS